MVICCYQDKTFKDFSIDTRLLFNFLTKLIEPIDFKIRHVVHFERYFFSESKGWKEKVYIVIALQKRWKIKHDDFWWECIELIDNIRYIESNIFC